MSDIWTIEAQDVCRLQGNDEAFVRLMNDLLAQLAWSAGIPGSQLRLTLKVDAPDGGVDAALDQTIAPALDPAGFADVPTCWQFKALPTRNIKADVPKGEHGGQEVALRQEINKPYARELILKGYGYRFCISDDLPPETKAKWEGWLFDEARKIRPDGPPPRVVTATDVATWGNHFPGATLSIRPPILGAFRHLRKWAEEITHETRHFVPVSAWQERMRAIHSHADLGQPCSGVVLIVQGEAGVGKTRCVYESLGDRGANRSLVVYTSNYEEAEKLAEFLGNNDPFRAILVVDECPVTSWVRLERLLTAHAGRVRVIAIDNSSQEGPTSPVEIRLVKMANDEVEAILRENFPVLPNERLRAFVELSGGFVRLALDLCRQAHLIPSEGVIGPLVPFFRDRYLAARLPDEQQRQAVEVIALLPRVGYKGEIRGQLDALCGAVGLDRDRVVQAAVRLKQAPGFIALGERYLYVTPQLVAQAAFQSAWARWIAPDAERFFVERLPAALVDAFADQVRACGTVEMRQDFFHFFQTWIRGLAAPDLGDEDTVRRLARLVEVEPSTSLPQLRRLIESIPVSELRRIHSPLPTGMESSNHAANGVNGPACRRELVWLAGKLLRLPEFFADAERILFRLALAETEVYANNASGVWRGIFRPLLSGTPVPFTDRLRLLEQHLLAAPEELTLSLQALFGALGGFGPAGRPLGPPIVAGRIPPDDWRPASPDEARNCLTLLVGLLGRLSRSENLPLREGVLDTTIEYLPRLLLAGHLADAQTLLVGEVLSETQRAKLLDNLDRFLMLHGSPGRRGISSELEASVRDWRQRLIPGTLHGRLMSVIGRAPWSLWNDADHGEQAIETLAGEMLAESGAVEHELPWLCSREAQNAGRLGEAMGRLDAGGVWLERIVRAAAASPYPAFGHGYLLAFTQRQQDQSTRVNALLDELQPVYPRGVVELLGGAGDALRPLGRVLDLVDSGRLPVEFLGIISYSLLPRRLTAAELNGVLDRLVRAGQRGNEAATQAALRVLWMQLSLEKKVPGEELPAGDVLRWVRTVLAASLSAPGPEAYAWWGLLAHLEGGAPEQALALAVRALTSDALDLADQAVPYLAKRAAQHPDVIVRLVGEALLDPSLRWPLELRPLREVFRQLPLSNVSRWLRDRGLPAARALARHLPPPLLDPSGAPAVPEVTAFVLDHFGDDERVLANFVAGTHSRVELYPVGERLEQQDTIARRFLDHPSGRIRDWAQAEIDRVTQEAAWWRAREEEVTAP